MTETQQIVERFTNPAITEAEREYRRLRFKATRDALRIERACDHPTIVYKRGESGDWPTNNVFICLHCRMEYQTVWYCNPEQANRPGQQFVTPEAVGVRNIYALRTRDARPIIHGDRYDARPPVRRRRKAK